MMSAMMRAMASSSRAWPLSHRAMGSRGLRTRSQIACAVLISTIMSLSRSAATVQRIHGTHDLLHPNHGHDRTHTLSQPAEEALGRDGIVREHHRFGYHDALLPPMEHEQHGSQLLVHHEDGSPDNWRLLCAWFTGVEGVPPVSIAVSSLEKASSVWSHPRSIIKEEDKSLQNPVWMWDQTTGTIHLFHTSQRGTFQGKSVTQVIRSTDGGESWSVPEVIFPEKATYVRNHPLKTLDGGWLLPLYHTPHGFHNKVPQFSEVRRSHDGGYSWSNGTLLSTKGMALVQPAIVRLVDRETGERTPRLAAFFRSRHNDNIYRSESHDDGLTWTTPRPIILPNNNKAIQAAVLQSGDIALVFNNNRGEWSCRRDGRCPDGRMHPMSIGLSHDEGHTWPYVRDLQPEFDPELDYTYPSIVQTPDGDIHVTYTWSRVRKRAAIRYVRITEQWVKQCYAWGCTRGVYQPSHSHTPKGQTEF